ncbi:hypothetical protein GUJ93_ZPchr0013g33870 [Zizania palustris]|uniref:Uncharacterized protein n=1 Tax=Zizania palustris TaxID=103762 RepID=A0A8J5WXN6_ZIZPA|nr:hypothetical protein GUJ93_ZPchr0013g33870 [Zizania palustris]
MAMAAAGGRHTASYGGELGGRREVPVKGEEEAGEIQGETARLASARASPLYGGNGAEAAEPILADEEAGSNVDSARAASVAEFSSASPPRSEALVRAMLCFDSKGVPKLLISRRYAWTTQLSTVGVFEVQKHQFMFLSSLKKGSESQQPQTCSHGAACLYRRRLAA